MTLDSKFLKEYDSKAEQNGDWAKIFGFNHHGIPGTFWENRVYKEVYKIGARWKPLLTSLLWWPKDKRADWTEEGLGMFEWKNQTFPPPRFNY